MKVKVSEISTHPANEIIYSINDSNTNELKESIKSIGLLEPIVLDSNKRIISGHRRYYVIKNQLEWNEVECIIRDDISEEDSVLYLISFNNQRKKTIQERLNEYNELDKVYSFKQGKKSNGYNRRKLISEAMGISETMLYRLLFIKKKNPKLLKYIEEDKLSVRQAFFTTKRIEKEKKSSRIKITDKTSSISDEMRKVYFKSSEDMNEVEDSSIDLVITSPPYFQLRKYHDSLSDEIGSEKTDDLYIERLTSHFASTINKMKKTASFLLNIGDTYKNGSQLFIPYRLADSISKKYGLKIRSSIVWKKTNPRPESDAIKRASLSYELIFHFTKSDDYKFNLLKMKSDSQVNQVSLAPHHHSSDGKYHGKMTGSVYISDGYKKVSDIWIESDIVQASVSNPKTNKNTIYHPARMQKSIYYIPIMTFTDEGDTILDPFCGSGVILDISQELNRYSIGYDIKRYIDK